MILHAASIAAFFAGQLAQPPVQIQCVQQAEPESWVKWLLQFALSIVPVAGGVGIALWSFHATSKREHKRWILDQKKAEWKELFTAITEVQKEFPPIYVTELLTIGKEEKITKEIANKWNEIERKIDVIAMMPFIFIAQKLIDIKFDEALKDFKNKASKDIPGMPKLIENRGQSYPSMKEYQTGADYRDPQTVYCGIVDEYGRIVETMRNHAEMDLDIRIRRSFRGSDEAAHYPPSVAGE